MAIWLTRRDLGDPATFVHANADPSGYGRPWRPACGVPSTGLRYRGDLDLADVPTGARCAGCTAALQQPPARP